MLDAESLSIATNINRARAEVWVENLNMAMDQFNITTPLRMAAFVAQCAHESRFFTRWVEDLSYSTAGRIRAVFGSRRFPTDESAQVFVRNPEALANVVYANRLGNGPASSGDGWRYRGRGLLQITGRTNYWRASQGLEEDYVTFPDLVTELDRAALVSAWWWADNGCNTAADSGDIDTVTRIVNGPAMMGREERERIFRDCFEAFST